MDELLIPTCEGNPNLNYGHRPALPGNKPKFVFDAANGILYMYNGREWLAVVIAKRYVANISQLGAAVPVATVRENDYNKDVTYTRTSSGLYVGTLSGAFASGKTVIIQTDMQAVADITVNADSFTLATDGDGKLTGQTLYIEERL